MDAPVPAGPGWPPYAAGKAVLECLHVVLNEEWEHHGFCVRDLADGRTRCGTRVRNAGGMCSLEAERPSDYLTRLADSELGRAYKSMVIEELRIGTGSTVLDLGCGPGADLAAFAAATGRTGRVVGIDSDAEAIGHATAIASGSPEVEVLVGDAHELALADRSVDRVHTDRALQHVARPDVVLGEVARVLRPGGIAAFAEPDWDTLVIDFPNPDTPAAYRAFIADHVVRNARIGRSVSGLCERQGLRATRVIPVTAVFREVEEADRVFGFQRVTSRAVAARYLSATAATAWLDHLRTEPFFASVSLFVTLAESPGAQG